MASSFYWVVCRRLYQTFPSHRWHLQAASRSFSSTSYKLVGDPSQQVTGVTEKDLEANPVLAAYFAANFSNQQEEDASEGPTEGESDDVETVSFEEAAESDLNIRSLFCYKRDPVEEEGSRRSRKLRLLGEIPGLLYGGDPNLEIFSHERSSQAFVKTPWNQLHRELVRYHRHFESRVYDLTVYEDPEDDVGTVHRVLPRDVQRHPVQNKIYCANYLRYFPGRPIKIPIVYINEEESPALKKDGFIAPVNRYVECVVEDGARIPDHLELECTGLRRKDVIRMNRIIFPDGVKPSWRIKDPDFFLVGTVFGRASAEMEEEGEENVEEGAEEEQAS